MRESFDVLFRLFGEGCAVASMLGLLEAREAAARVRVEDLREAAARAAAVLEAAEIELDRRVIAREELVEALAVSAAGTTAVTEPETKAELPVPVPVPLPGRTVPFWRGGLPATVLAPDYQRILGVVADRSGQGPVRAKEISVVLGLGSTPAKVEGGAVEGEAFGGARVAGAGGVGDVQCRPWARGRARRRLIRVIIASLVAVRVS